MDLVRAGRLAEAVEAFSAQARASGAAHDYYNMALAAAQLGRAEQVADALADREHRLLFATSEGLQLGALVAAFTTARVAIVAAAQ